MLSVSEEKTGKVGLLIEIDKHSQVPKHLQVENWLRGKILDGSFSPGSKIPGRKEFSEMLGGVNYLTVNKAVMTLAREGLLQTTVGRGTFVTEPKKKQARIALLLPSIESAHGRATVRGVQDFCHAQTLDGSTTGSSKQNVGLILFDSRRDSFLQIENIKHLEDLPLDGAIVAPVAFSNMVEHLVRLQSSKFPIVLLEEISNIPFPSVSSDNYDGAYRLTQHVLASGRKRIAWIGCRKGFFSGQQRYEGYHHAMCDSGTPVDRRLECELEMSSPAAPFQGALEVVVHRLLAANPPDAIICSNDLEAMATIKLLQQRGLSVPGDIAVAGFGGQEADENFRPALTSALVESEKIGRTAAELLLKLIENPNSPVENVNIPMPLLLRQSA